MARLRRTDQRGYSLVELMFVVGIAGIAISSIVRFTFQSRMDLSRQEVATDLYNTNARIGSNLREDLQSAQFILANYSTANMTALMAVVRASTTAGGAPAPVAFTMPPVVTTMNDPDLTGTAAATWGDELMYVAQLSPVTFTVQDPVAWGGCTCTSSTLAVERFQFVYDYLTNANTATIPDLGRSLRMVQWRSAPFFDLGSIDPTKSGRSPLAISETVATVMAMGYTTALDIFNTQAITTAFYTLVSPSSGPIYTTTPVTSAMTTLPQSSWAYMDDYDSLQAYKTRAGVNRGQISNSGGFGSIAAPYTKSIAYNTTGAG
ncbi:MAG TPA: type II secretion system protein, partial [bacterium]|nr:type II secretion system protein [bacterium]